MKGTVKQQFPLLLFIFLYKMASPSMKMKFIIQMKATEQYFPLLLFSMLYKVILTFETVGEILKCDHSNESY